MNRQILERFRAGCAGSAVALLVASGLAMPAFANAPVIYPAQGQTPDQQTKDQGECHVWAVQTTGVDPAALATQAPQSTQTAPGGQRVRGAARGAAGGAAIGAIAGDAGEGAAIGAVAGTMAGGRRSRMAQQQGQQAAQAQRNETVNTYYRAVAACMTGRGYTVQ